jgi:hypothetical protein
MSVLSLVPWNRAPLRKDNPEGNVWVLPFAGAGRVTHLILEDQRRVDLLQCSGSLSPRQRSTLRLSFRLNTVPFSLPQEMPEPR